MRYIGDISSADARLLAGYARGAARILEFGAGASTQVLAQSCPDEATVLSVETEPAWIERTRQNFARLSIQKRVEFLSWRDWTQARATQAPFDLIFDDGKDNLRATFALQAFALLKVGGRLLLHDTRREQDLRNVVLVLKRHYLEIASVGVNEAGSNTTVITRKSPQPWVDWNREEGRARWEYGHAEPPSPLPAGR